jgi:hypothetical protein
MKKNQTTMVVVLMVVVVESAQYACQTTVLRGRFNLAALAEVKLV